MNLHRALCVSWLMLVSLVSGCVHAAESFSFVQLCDPQLGHHDYALDKAHFEQAVAIINTLKPDLVIICGDLVNNAGDEKAWNDFLAIKSRLQMPCYCVPGNHDVGNEFSAGLREAYLRRMGKDFQAFEHGGYTFVLTNTSLWKVQVPELSEEHSRWFEATLQKAAAQNQPIFVAGHIPPFTENPLEKEHYFNLPESPRKRLLALAKQYGVKAFLMGHVHRNCLIDYEGISMVASASTCKNSDADPGFRLWQVNADGIIVHSYVPIVGVKAE